MRRKSDPTAELARDAVEVQSQTTIARTKEGQFDSTNSTGIKSVATPSIAPVRMLLPGRRSFGGFNPFIEKNYQTAVDNFRLDVNLKSKRENNSSNVSDAEMIARYENLVGLPRGPSQGQAPKGKKMRTK